MGKALQVKFDFGDHRKYLTELCPFLEIGIVSILVFYQQLLKGCNNFIQISIFTFPLRVFK